jgi:hypothetical protein
MSKSKRTKYKGWLIVQDGDSFLCFTPDEIDYPERGYEDLETDSLEAAKEWIDGSIDYEAGRKVPKLFRTEGLFKD